MADSMTFFKRGDCAVYVREKYATAAAATTAHNATSSLPSSDGQYSKKYATHGKRTKHETESRVAYLGSE